jgi:hypothetical protein
MLDINARFSIDGGPYPTLFGADFGFFLEQPRPPGRLNPRRPESKELGTTFKCVSECNPRSAALPVHNLIRSIGRVIARSRLLLSLPRLLLCGALMGILVPPAHTRWLDDKIVMAIKSTGAILPA